MSMTTRLEYRHNGGYDSVLLVDAETGIVRSDWTVDRQVMDDFCDCTEDAGDWDDRGGDEHKADDYGDLVAVREGHTLTAIDAKKWEDRMAFQVR